MSQVSDGGLSDILGEDVNTFVEKNNIKHLYQAMTQDTNMLEQEQDFKLPEGDYKLFGDLDFPAPPTCGYQGPSVFPPEQPANLCNEEYPGAYDFEVFIVPSEKKTPWEYSHLLNKVFIPMGTKFPVAFSVKPHYRQSLFIRVTPAYSQSQFFQEPVHRCTGHQHAKDELNSDVPLHKTQHIIRCDNPKAQYFGNQNNYERLSIVMPLTAPQAGTDTVKEYFHFVCKNSCPNGMNRRPIEVIFTLENGSGEVLGRRSFCVRICSCPKRDREKEELSAEKTNKLNKPMAPHGKKRKVDSDERKTPPAVDSSVCQMQIPMVGKQNQRRMLEYGRALMTLAAEGEAKSRQDGPFKKCLRDIEALLNKMPE